MWLGPCLITILRPIIKLLFRVRVVGAENIPQIPGDPKVILCSNHISNWDPIFLLIGQRRHVHFMAKAELFSNRLFTWFFEKQVGAFPVKRGTGDTKAVTTAEDLIVAGKLVGIFPEGTRSKTGELLRPKSGASLIVSQTGAHVLPVAVVTKGQKVRLFQPVTLVFGELLSPEALQLDNPQAPNLRYASRTLMATIASLMEGVQ